MYFLCDFRVSDYIGISVIEIYIYISYSLIIIMRFYV